MSGYWKLKMNFRFNLSIVCLVYFGLCSHWFCYSHLLIREVEDFARRLNSDWPERMQEILSLGQERRRIPMAIHGNGSLSRYPSKLPFLFFMFIMGVCFVFSSSLLWWFEILYMLSRFSFYTLEYSLRFSLSAAFRSWHNY